MTTITYASGTVTPEYIDGYEPARRAQTILHEIIGNPRPVPTFRPASSRAGVLLLGFATRASADNALAVFAVARPYALTSPDRPSADMAFVVADGDLRVYSNEVDDWIVEVPFREVDA